MPTTQHYQDTLRRRREKVALCSKCKQEKPWDQFIASPSRRPFGLASLCSDCDAARKRDQHKRRAAKLRATDPDRLRAEYRRGNLRRFGLTLADYEAMFAAQGGVCAICGEPERDTHWVTGEPQSLAVDHDAKTGKVRALLCALCNKGIGSFLESPERLLAAIEYLRRHKS